MKQRAFAIVRIDDFQGADCDLKTKITVKEIVPTESQAEDEVKRLMQLNADKGCSYFWTHTRLIGFRELKDGMD